jgi:hypothetical protein
MCFVVEIYFLKANSVFYCGEIPISGSLRVLSLSLGHASVRRETAGERLEG